MSRLIVKNLPSYVTPEQLKEHFLQKKGPGGTLTDVKVAQKPDGTSRRFGFLGFKSEAEANKARDYFDRTFIGTTRIIVQVVEKGAKDAPAPRPNKKPRLELAKEDERSSLKSEKSKDEKVSTTAASSIAPKSKKDRQAEEFMQVMQPRTKKVRTWANDDLTLNTPVTSAVDVKMKDADAAPEVVSGAKDDAEDEGSVEEVDDLEWMKRRMQRGIQSTEVEEKAFTEDEEDTSTDSPKASTTNVDKLVEKQSEPVEAILKSGRLFLRNLSYSCVESDLQKLFEPYGSINQVHISLDPVTKVSKGIAFVTFMDPACAVKAFEELDKTSFQGRLLHILPAAERKSSGVQAVEEGTGKSTVKGEKGKRRKENASKEFNWSFLYMNADAVASSIADRMNISKVDILNPDATDEDSTSAAVKLALAETHIISETKAYLEAEGINLSAFSSIDLSSGQPIRARRSDTCILVKNIPYGTTVDQIRELFEPHGELNRVLVPPAGTIAVVDYVHSDEAAKGFRAVAYRRLGSSVIYLEKAPMGIFTSTPKDKAERTVPVVPKTAGSKDAHAPMDSVPVDGADADEVEAAPGSTLFVKNLSFATTTERLSSVFRHLPGFAFGRVQTKPDPNHTPVPGQPAARLSMGYGFVGFKDQDSAKQALRSMQGFVLDGHTLTVKFSGRGTEEDKAAEAKANGIGTSTTTKMIVKNVPFEATKKDLRALFGAHGQLKSVRLPRKFGASTRGFAFLDFVSRWEAENAYASLRHTHLLGRHLVLEWARDGDQDVDELRKKAGVGYGDNTELPGRKRKLELRDDEEEVAEDSLMS